VISENLIPADKTCVAWGLGHRAVGFPLLIITRGSLVYIYSPEQKNSIVGYLRGHGNVSIISVLPPPQLMSHNQGHNIHCCSPNKTPDVRDDLARPHHANLRPRARTDTTAQQPTLAANRLSQCSRLCTRATCKWVRRPRVGPMHHRPDGRSVWGSSSCRARGGKYLLYEPRYIHLWVSGISPYPSLDCNMWGVFPLWHSLVVLRAVNLACLARPICEDMASESRGPVDAHSGR